MKAVAKYLPIKNSKKVKLFAVTQSEDKNRETRILGEISLNATWVKEGDEIEVRLWDDESLNSMGKAVITPNHLGAVYTRGYLIYQVKCPNCKKYI